MEKPLAKRRDARRLVEQREHSDDRRDLATAVRTADGSVQRRNGRRSFARLVFVARRKLESVAQLEQAYVDAAAAATKA